MLKRGIAALGGFRFVSQPPSGGCVLKRFIFDLTDRDASQPPSGGCVLKQAVV
ncbi:hypothetical protein l13_04440 [Neisseria weaveri ATCC 51223]|nr:hypothetical protein l13_04440 [Neisseria weaveri ATCC 51223]